MQRTAETNRDQHQEQEQEREQEQETVLFESSFKHIIGLISLLITFSFLAVAIRSTMDFEESFYFLGEPKSFDRQYNEAVGYEATKVMHQCFTFVIACMLRDKAKIFNPQIVADQLIRDHPECILGFAMRAYLAKLDGDMEEAKAWLKKMEEVAEANPTLAEKMSFVRMTEKDLEPSVTEPEFREVVRDKVWVVKEAMTLDSGGDPMLIQASILKLNSGEIVIVNPTSFSPQTKEKIDSLGPVKIVITTTGGHGKGVAIAQDLWPDALLYGTDPNGKHDRPTLNWKGFLANDGKKLLGDELPYHLIEGQIFNEAVIYHRPSKTLVGLTDLAIDMREVKKDPTNAPWSLRTYLFGLGNWRGPFTRDIETQSYMNGFAISRTMMRESFAPVSLYLIDHVTLGHGGVISYPDEAFKLFARHYEWALDPKLNHHPFTGLARNFHWFAVCSGLPRNAFFGLLSKVGLGPSPIPRLTEKRESQ